MKRIFPVLTLMLLLCVNSIQGADLSPFRTGDDMAVFCDQVTALVKDEKIDEAFALLDPRWVIPPDEVSGLKIQMRQQLAMVRERFGAPVSFVLVSREEVKDIAMRYTYVIKYQKHIIRVIYTFYKPGEFYLLNGLKWDDSLGELFQR